MDEIKRVVDFYRRQSLLWKIFFAVVFIVVILYFISNSVKGGDFVTFLEASTKMLLHQNIYDPPYINLRYSYSPFWAMVLIPFALMPKGFGAFLWLVISFGLLWRSFFLLRTHFGVMFSDRRHDHILWFLIILYMSRYIELNFHHVQMTICLLWMILESLYQVDKGNEIYAGILIGLGTIIKIMPVVMIPYFIYRRRFIATGSSIITVIVAFLLPVIYVGKEQFVAINKSWYAILRPDSPEFQTDAVWHFPQNLSAMMYRLLVNTGAPYTPNLFTMEYPQASLVIWGVVLLLVLFTLYFLNSMPFRRSASEQHTLYEVSYMVLLIPLIFPHQMKYAFYFVLPAICCLFMVLVSGYDKEKKSNSYRATFALLLLSFVLCTMTTDLIIGMKLSTITQHWKTITIGTLLLIPALAINRKHFA